MSDPPITGSTRERLDAERLSRAWNALVQGDAAAATVLDPGDLDAIERLAALAGGSQPRPAFISQLKEDLMETSVPAPLDGALTWGSPVTLNHVRHGGSSVRRRRWWDGPRRGLDMVATLALIVVTLAVSLAVFSRLELGGGRPSDPGNGAFGGSPEVSSSPEADAAEAPACAAIDPYYGCVDVLRLINSGYPPLTYEDIVGSQVQLQGWAVGPGVAISGADVDGAASGAVVDFVLSGAYVATFNVPVVVGRGGWTHDMRMIEHLDAGATVELGRGDTVSYQLGGLVELRNPLSQQRIEFKRAVIYEGDVSPFLATVDGVTNRIEGEATVASGLGISGGPGASVSLWYVQIPDWVAFPPSNWEGETIIGPVDPQWGSDGFILKIGKSLG